MKKMESLLHQFNLFTEYLKNKDCDSLSELGKYTSIVVIDEAHHAVSSNKSYTQVLKVLGFNFKNSTKKGVDINEIIHVF